MPNGSPIVLGNADTSTKQTTVTATTPPAEAGLRVQNYSGTGIAAGALRRTALTAGSVGGTAIHAESFAGSGVVATCVDTRDKPGISVAVSGSVPGGFGVLGDNARGQFPEAGVTGRALMAIGVDGISRTGFGVRGMTRSNAVSGAGVMGVGSPGHGVVGIARQTFTTPVIPPPFVPGGPLFAGLFLGNVQVQGDFTVTGAKAAVVRHPDGTHRRLYCVESPESWFEDFGRGTLNRGRATVTFDPTFAALVVAKDYHVFITPEGDCKGLFVGRKTSRGFDVRELQKGTSSVAFSYRIVARRRGAQGKRLDIVALGQVPGAVDAVVPGPTPPRPDASPAQELADLARSARSKGKSKGKR